MKIACDTHVHCYDFNRLSQQLDFAVKNFDRYATDADARVLFFTDGFVDRTWLRLQELINKQSAKQGQWQFSYEREVGLIVAQRDDGETIYIAPARQVNTAGRLEILLLGCQEELDDRQPANQLINKYSDDYVLILPWGVGKWLGKRGRLLVDLINHSSKSFYLGDNGGRPFFWPVPHFRLLRQLQSNQKSQNPLKKSLPVINGSDPLPINGEIARTASYGVKFNLTGSKKIALKNILVTMKSDQVEFENYGRLMGLLSFVFGRIKMLLR